MDLEVVSTGEKIWKCDDGAGRALLAAFPEAFRRIEKPTFNVQQKANPAAPRWAVQKNPWSDRMEICLTVLNSVTRYPGSDCKSPTAEDAKVLFKSVTGHEPPAHILEEFAAVLKSGSGLNLDQILESRLQAQTEQYAREQQERIAETKLKVIG